MHFGPYIQVIAGGLGSCGYWCGYHSNVDIGDLVPGVPRVAIGGIPDFFVGGGCDRCGGSDQLGKTLATASHEIAEATLDPDGNSSGWDEVADLCGDQAKVTAYNGKTFEVQNLWSNAHDRCVFSPNAVNTKTTRPATTVVKTSTTTTMKPTTTTTTTTTTAAATTSKPTTTTTTTTTTTAAPSSTKTTKTTTTTTTTTKTNPTTTKPAGGISNGVACTSFGARACNNACTCNYASNNALVWQCNPTNISC
ncbi:hypothetical protein BDR26DRAFT_862644 [Obelidium mucronatum]|nr:hypothetical protein BDR26DRAFT_862644 [Obelidium mucronatum]